MSNAIDKNTKAWFIVTAYSSHENKVKDNIEKRIEAYNLQDYVFRVEVADIVETVIDSKGNEKQVTKNLYPGYIFVEMIMTDDSWYMIRNTPGVTGIAGSSGGGTKPIPVPMNEMESVLKRIGKIDESIMSKYNIGDKVVIINGVFKDTDGVIVGISEEGRNVEVEITFFGRTTVAKVDFSDVDRI